MEVVRNELVVTLHAVLDQIEEHHAIVAAGLLTDDLQGLEVPLV